VPGGVATRQEQVPAAAVAEHIAAAEERMPGAAGIAAPHTEAVGEAEAVRTAAGLAERVAATKAQPRVRHTQPEAVARVLPVMEEEALHPLKPRPARRRKGSLSLKEERRVRIADISS
jgi:hypothetical protein